jgi:hypothetical protein
MQRKLGSTRGSPRRSRTAKAPHINRWAVKLRCACEWGAWGRVSDDGPGQYNLDRSEGPWGRWVTHRMAVHYRAHGPAQYGTTDVGHEVHEGRRQTRRTTADAGSRLKLEKRTGQVPPDKPAFQPYWGKPAVRLIGGIEETSASFEVRSAPRSYPTIRSPVAIVLPDHRCSWNCRSIAADRTGVAISNANQSQSPTTRTDAWFSPGLGRDGIVRPSREIGG